MATSKFVPSHPHFFKPLLPGFLEGVSIPISFFTKYLNAKSSCEHGVLRTSCGEWEVKIDGRGRIEDTGWTDFAHRHNLRVGDMVVFSHQGDMVFDVTVFDPITACEREYQHPLKVVKVGSDSEPESMEDLNRNKAKDGCSTRRHPYFVSTIMSTSAAGSKHGIPSSFARSHGLWGRRCDMILKDENKLWPVRLGHSKHQSYIMHGWTQFRMANDLKKGDIVTFELIQNGAKPVMLFRRLNGGPSAAKGTYPKMKKGYKQYALQYFIVTLTRFNLKSRELQIPMKFARLHDLQKYEEVKIKDCKQQQWLLSIRKRKSRGRLYIGHGNWKEFVKANGLKEGHFIKLELTEGRGKTLLINFSLYGVPAAGDRQRLD